MVQPNLTQTSGKNTKVEHKMKPTNTINPELTKATNIKSVNFDPQDKCQSPLSHQRSTKNSKKSPIPWLDNIKLSLLSPDSYSDSDQEADNIKNVTRWLETLPNNQDWCKIEDDSLDRQGDFGKDQVSRNENSEKFDPTQPSTSSYNDSWESKISEIKSNKKSPAIVKLDKSKIPLRERTREIRNSSFSKLSDEQRNKFRNSSYRLRKLQNSPTTSRADNRKLSIRDVNREQRIEKRRHPYNLRSLDSRKVEIIDSAEKLTRARRRCSVRCQEKRRRARETIFANGTERRSDSCEMENLNPARKLKSPFTKQAKGNALGLFSEMPSNLSSMTINEFKEMKENFQKLDQVSEKEKHLDRKLIVRSKLENNKKLLSTVKDIINVIDNNNDSIPKSLSFRKSYRAEKEEIDKATSKIVKESNQELEKEVFRLNNLQKTKPTFVNSRLEKDLDIAMKVSVNRYKRSYGNREINWSDATNQGFDQLEEPPKKKTKISCGFN